MIDDPFSDLLKTNKRKENISIQLGLKGKCTNVVTACASGTHCIGDAFRAIEYGDADVMAAIFNDAAYDLAVGCAAM